MMIEEGKHRARAVNAVLGQTGTGKEQVVVEWKLIDDDRRIASYHFFSSEQAIEISMNGLRTAGFLGNDLGDLSSLQVDGDYQTPECELVIIHETYDGKTRAKVKYINRGGGLGGVKQLDATAAKSFTDRMKSVIANLEDKDGSIPF